MIELNHWNHQAWYFFFFGKDILIDSAFSLINIGQSILSVSSISLLFLRNWFVHFICIITFVGIIVFLKLRQSLKCFNACLLFMDQCWWTVNLSRDFSMCVKSVMLNLQIFGDFFPSYISVVIVSLIPLWTEHILCMISILLNLLRFVL